MYKKTIPKSQFINFIFIFKSQLILTSSACVICILGLMSLNNWFREINSTTRLLNYEINWSKIIINEKLAHHQIIKVHIYTYFVFMKPSNFWKRKVMLYFLEIEGFPNQRTLSNVRKNWKTIHMSHLISSIDAPWMLMSFS